MDEFKSQGQLNFDNTAKAFDHKSDRELRDTHRLFNLMRQRTLVALSSNIGKWVAKLDIGLVNGLIRDTIFKQFCGGESLLGCQSTIDQLYAHKIQTILDYGLEGKSSESDIEHIKDEIIRGAKLAASNDSVPVVVIKLSAFADNSLLENASDLSQLSNELISQYDQLVDRVDTVCRCANELGVGVFIDGEESWVQDTIDRIAMQMMRQYNQSKCVVYNTFQMYRHDRLDFLIKSYEQAESAGIYLGAKIVRGAYMEKERNRAKEYGYPSPIQVTKEDTDRDYNEAIRFCIEHYDRISSCCASHNLESNYLQATLMDERKIDHRHPHLNFCQLYGMSDYISYNLVDAGYNVSKYVPYGPIKEVIPYLIRRAKENSSVTGEVGRELKYLTIEIERRNI